jgi:meckelin
MMKVNLLQLLLIASLCMKYAKSAFVSTAEVNPAIYMDLTYTSCASKGFDYFDSLDGNCKNCEAGMIADKTKTDSYGNPTECICAPGYSKTIVNCAGTSDGLCKKFTCTACSGGTLASYRDSSSCTSCGTGATYDNTIKDCKCTTSTEVLVETDVLGTKTSTKTCTACPSGTQVILTDQMINGKQYYADSYSCQSCPSSHMSMDSSLNCVCDVGYTITGQVSIGSQSCIFDTMISEFKQNEDVSSMIKYDKTVSISSSIIKHYYSKSAAECKYYGGASDAKACQTLANLCVLTLYDTSYGPCAAFQAIMLNRGSTFTNNILNWNSAMPWLFISNTQAACFAKDYHTQVSLNKQYFQYIIGSYTLNGTFIGYQPIETLFSYCSRSAPFSGTGGGDSSSSKWQIFGSTEDSKYSCDLNTLMTTEQLFYEMYLYDPKRTSGQASGYMPVPVRVVNMTQNSHSSYVNNLHPQPLCAETDVLTRRFTLIDIVSGLSSTSQTTPEIIRYAKDITVEVSLSKENYGIFSPILSIYYDIARPGLWTSPKAAIAENGIIDPKITSRTVTYNFSGRYTMNIDDFKEIFYGWGITSGVFCGLLSLFRFNMWSTRNTRLNAPESVSQGGGLFSLIELSLLSMSSWVYFYFPIQTLICWYFFTFFKLQGVPSNLLPPTDDIYSRDSPYYMFTINIILMFFFQLFYVLVIVYRQCNSDVFFLDWEPPSGNTTDGKRVSVWRTIFVANEWSEMTTMRKIDIKMNLFFLGLILIGCNQDYAATQQPDVYDLTPGKTNIILRFANTTWWWLLLSSLQWLWKFLIYERFFAETREQQFIDFCTIAKVSILVLDEPFHGYYLHCRSPHQHADGTMQELIDMLHKEEAGLTVDRSLTDGPSDVQSFQFYTSGEWKVAFSKIYNNLIRPSSVSDILQNGRKQRGFAVGGAGGVVSRGMSPRADGSQGGSGSGAATDRTIKAWKELTIFLQEFVENNFGKPGLRRIIREPTYWENMVNQPPDLNVPEQPNVFYPDRNFQYTSTLFLGRELELLLFNITVYSAFDLWLQSTAKTIVITYAFDWCLCWIREVYGGAVLSSKTLIDERFLM